MTPRRLALLRVTPEAIAEALGLLPGLRVYRILDGLDAAYRADAAADWVLVLEDTTGERLPEMREGFALFFVEPETVIDSENG